MHKHQAISKGTLRKRRVTKILRIVCEAETMPRTWNKGVHAWKKHVAIKHGVALQSLYRWLVRYNEREIAGLVHTKKNKGQPKAWTPEGLNFWICLCLRPSFRWMPLKMLFEEFLFREAQIRSWNIGGFSSAIWWCRKKATPVMAAIGGSQCAFE